MIRKERYKRCEKYVRAGERDLALFFKALGIDPSGKQRCQAARTAKVLAAMPWAASMARSGRLQAAVAAKSSASFASTNFLSRGGVDFKKPARCRLIRPDHMVRVCISGVPKSMAIGCSRLNRVLIQFTESGRRFDISRRQRARAP